MHVVLVDRDEPALLRAQSEISLLGARSCTSAVVDVSSAGAVMALKSKVLDRHGTVHFLFCNAGTGDGGGALANLETWHSTLGTNLWGVIHFCQAFVPAMLAGKQPGIVVNTGSKQGVTLPPVSQLSYNVSKAALKAYTEGLQHELRGTADCQVTGHLLLPAFVYSMIRAKGMRDQQARKSREDVLARGGSKEEAEFAAKQFVRDYDLEKIKLGEHMPGNKPADAWTADETADFVLRRLREGSFYLTQPEADEPPDGRKTLLRMIWSMNDLLKDRPPMSRWESGHTAAFEEFMTSELRNLESGAKSKL